MGVVDLPLSGWSTVSHYRTRCETDNYFYCFATYNNSCLRVFLFLQYETISAFILNSVILLNSPLNYSHMQQQAHWSTQTLRGNLVLVDSTKLPVPSNVASTEQQVCTQCHMYLHSFFHSLYFPYIHIQVKYQGCGNCQSSCINIC